MGEAQSTPNRPGAFPDGAVLEKCIGLRALIDHGSRDNHHLFGRSVCLLDGNSRVADYSLGNSKKRKHNPGREIPLGVLAGDGDHFQTAIRASPYVVVT